MRYLNKIAFLSLIILLEVVVIARSQSSLGNSTNPPGDIALVGSAIRELKNGGAVELKVEFVASNFRVLKSTVRPITKEMAEEAISKSKVSFPQIRFTKDSQVVSYKVSAHRWIEEETREHNDKQVTWVSRSFRPIATFPNSEWTSFLTFTLKNGLADFTVDKVGKERREGEMRFAPTRLERVEYGTGVLTFSPEFYQTMQFSPKYRPSRGINGFIILVHDPHSDVSGRHDLLLGLDALRKSNPLANFEFLVEGAFPEVPGQSYVTLQSRSLSDGGLKQYLQTQPSESRGPLIQSMLRDYMIDTPLAYRLSHNDLVIPAYGIDDNRYLKETAVKFGDAGEEITAIQNIQKTVIPLISQMDIPENRKKELQSTVMENALYTLALEHADGKNAPDVLLPDYLQDIANGLDSLSKLANNLKALSPSLADDAKLLGVRSAAYKAEADSYRRALSRNVTMLSFIIPQARKSSPALPIAFIGNYHTQGITAELRKQNIGYVVIEPRPRIPYRHRKEEEEKFQEFVADPDAYFHRAAQTDKGVAGLSEKQVNAFHKPFITKRNTTIEGNRSRIRQTFGEGSQIESARLYDAIFNNLPQCEVRMAGSAGGAAGPPPDIPRGSFAFFEEQNDKPRLTIIDAASNRWKEGDRYGFLKKASFGLPYADNEFTPEISFSRHYQDETTGRGFYSLYDSRSKRVYLIEGTEMDVSALVTLPAVGQSDQIDVHMQLSEIFKQKKEEPMSAENPAIAPAAAWEIDYRGPSRVEADELKTQLELAGVPVGQPRELIQTDAKLGAEEIIITIIASAALKAIAQVAFDQLRIYLVQKISAKGKENKPPPNLQVVVKKHARDPGKRELLSLKAASIQAVDKFISNISDVLIRS